MPAKLLWEKQSHFCISCGPIGWYYVTILGGGAYLAKCQRMDDQMLEGRNIIHPPHLVVILYRPYVIVSLYIILLDFNINNSTYFDDVTECEKMKCPRKLCTYQCDPRGGEENG